MIIKAKQLKQGLEAERTNTVTIKADHIKQHKMHKNQIRDLKEKLSKAEVLQ